MNRDNQQIMQSVLNDLYDAYKFFNQELFNNILPDASITISDGKKGSNGTFSAKKFIPKDASDVTPIDDIMLNPISFGRDEIYVLSTLVHEMTHLQELHFGNPGKNSYHNKAWAQLMKLIGLQPSHNGQPGGRETGSSMSDYIIENGPFYNAATHFIKEKEFSIEFVAIEIPALRQSPRKVKYNCSCEDGPPLWASNSGMNITCNTCNEIFEVF